MPNNNFVKEICLKIKKGAIMSPILFLNKNKEILNSEVNDIASEILSEFKIPNSYLFKLEDNWDKIKIDELKRFLSKWDLKSSFECQIFFIENISRLTLSASNTCLKFFEEPWKWNIIFLTSWSEGHILDTILSRVDKINFSNVSTSNKKSNFYLSLIDNLVKKWDYWILSYFYKEKLLKEDYLSFLENVIYYSKDTWLFKDLLSSLEDDMNMIKNNNVLAKGIVDKVLLKINLRK